MGGAVLLVDYNPGWPGRFEAERALVATALGVERACIEHIGSTAVPGLGAKPVIDMMAGVAVLDDVLTRVSDMEAAGYEYVPEYEAQIPLRRYFRKPFLGPRTVHLHCVVRGGEHWVRHLAFRDYLRAHPDAARAYLDLKQALARSHDKAAYTDAKGPFIEAVVARALDRGAEGA